VRILIVRQRSLGDVIHALPVACAAKDHIPGAFVAWLAEDWASEVLVGHAAIDQRIVVTSSWMRSVPQILRVRRDLRAQRFDVVLDLQGVHGTVLATLLSGAPRRLGFVGMVGHELRQLIPNANRQRSVSRAIARALHFELVRASSLHIVERYLEILAPLGVCSPHARFGLTESAGDARAVADVIRAAGVAEQAYAVVNPGGRSFKMWPADRFAAIARHLGDAYGLPTLIVQGLSERERRAAAEVVAASRGSALLAPPLPLGQLAALARRTRLFVSGDTGPLHLAAAVGAPCVGLIAHAQAGWFRPYGSGNVLLQGTPVHTHRGRHPDLGAAAMQAIGVDAVRHACDHMLAPLA
jgi:ADP-heptose:LPS heptosyltransferase